MAGAVGGCVPGGAEEDARLAAAIFTVIGFGVFPWLDQIDMRCVDVLGE